MLCQRTVILAWKWFLFSLCTRGQCRVYYIYHVETILDAWFYLRFYISCGVAVTVRSHKKEFQVIFKGILNFWCCLNFWGRRHFWGRLHFCINFWGHLLNLLDEIIKFALYTFFSSNLSWKNQDIQIYKKTYRNWQVGPVLTPLVLDKNVFVVKKLFLKPEKTLKSYKVHLGALGTLIIFCQKIAISRELNIWLTSDLSVNSCLSIMVQ